MLIQEEACCKNKLCYCLNKEYIMYTHGRFMSMYGKTNTVL